MGLVAVIPFVLCAAGALLAVFSRGPGMRSARVRLYGISATFTALPIFLVALIDQSHAIGPDLTIWSGSALLAKHDAFIGILSFAMLSIGLIAAPRRALGNRSAIWVLPGIGAVYIMQAASQAIVVLVALWALYFALWRLSTLEAGELPDDERAVGRPRVFAVFGFGTLIGFSVTGALLVGSAGKWSSVFDIQIEEFLVSASGAPSGMLLAYMIFSSGLLGLFPFHDGVLSYLSAPRVNPVPSVALVCGGLTVLLRLVAPLFDSGVAYGWIVLTLAAIGLLYVSLLLLVERRIKRIAALLYLTQVCLLILQTVSAGSHSEPIRMLALCNIAVAFTGLAIAISAICARFGSDGVISRESLFLSTPEVGACFLVCMLSMIGFPGTVGYIEGELVVELLTETPLALTAVGLALAINGFSIFRAFGRTFFGRGGGEQIGPFPILWREKVCCTVIMVLIIVNGVAPQYVLKFLD
jgi:formate hydrogenlyase subunit 3/multisubunit Na+/H+ antiporter MnhD subunit